MKIDERVYLRIRSKQYSPDEITQLLGLAPDDVVDMRERQQSRVHVWRLFGGQNEEAASTSLSADIQTLADRLRPHAHELASLDRSQTDCSLVVLRRFYPAAEGASIGWRIAPDVLGFLCDARLDVDVDEYDYSNYDETSVDPNWWPTFSRKRPRQPVR